MTGDRCSMHSCDFKATHTDTIWTVDPSNISEKPVCKYHYILRELIDSSVTPLVVMSLTFLLSASFISTMDGIMSSIFSIVVIAISFLVSISLFLLTIIAIEFCLRYFFIGKPILRRVSKVVEEEGELDSEQCICCSEKDTSGVWRKYTDSLEFIGSPIKTYNEGVNHYCSSCYKKEIKRERKVSESEDKPEDQTNFLLQKNSK